MLPILRALDFYLSIDLTFAFQDLDLNRIDIKEKKRIISVKIEASKINVSFSIK